MKALYFYPKMAEAFENKADPETYIYERMKALVVPLDISLLCLTMLTAHRFRLRHVVALCAVEVRKQLEDIGVSKEGKGRTKRIDLVCLRKVMEVAVVCSDYTTGAKGYSAAIDALAKEFPNVSELEGICKPLGAYLELAVANLRAFY